ncbi:unnamed protein product [Dimorphilus gyrociliatus]|uniref:Nudix hydrolase domain-containing protein n=1 Tax=Dimorphilus gyrociliatus TaxID=2664684 RepID=A0A7I8VN48_9ANNE|nr:unnamed protein product [Dimorphilus gyrociliatus]
MFRKFSRKPCVIEYEKYTEKGYDSDERAHRKCIEGYYRVSQPERFKVIGSRRWGDEIDANYNPPRFTDSSVLMDPTTMKKPIWADLPESQLFNVLWNQEDELDGRKVNRKSFECDYIVGPACKADLGRCNLPLNPKGKTGIVGRGILGRWGPNHAADPIVTRWNLKNDGTKVLQFVAIKRGDNGEWAIPGGMVEPGENVSQTLIKEFCEEALGIWEEESKDISLETREEKRTEIVNELKEFFEETGVKIYSGYVDDPRNTDNAWVETTVFNFHETDSKTVSKYNLRAGDDAINVKWMNIDECQQLYASHLDFVRMVAEKHVVPMNTDL